VSGAAVPSPTQTPEPELEVDASPSEETTADKASVRPAVRELPAPAFAPPEEGPKLDGDASEVDLSAGELDVLFEGEGEDAEPEPAKPKHTLPRPKAVKSKAGEFQASTRRSTPPPLSGSVPKGIRPPAANLTKPEDTDVIIAALGAELIDEEPAAGESAEAPVVSTSSSGAPRFSAQVAVDDDEDFQPRGKQPPWLWIAAGAVAATLIAIVIVSGGDDDDKASPATEPTAAYSAAMSADSERREGEVKAAAPTRREAVPEEEPETERAAEPAVGEDAEAEDAVAEDAVAEEVEEVEPVEEVPVEPVEPVEPAEPADEAPPEPAGLAAPAEPPSTSAPNPGRNQHKRRHRSRSRDKQRSASPAPVAASAPKPSSASPTKSEPSAEELLASAKKALLAGSNSSAYSLAAKSRRQKRTNDATLVMARAACRLGSENKAKAAFSQLPMGWRIGVRSECRKKGIKLGL
jgi:hypothetical protein